ncbi:hypothetical protein Y032_0232g3041 [Ancylostoma ceylanicum]|uniref:Uncharacterized protein n=1 Tax=Ancylostoma ceylanicum TaxID=53326 RepID=A0A016SFM7_9BILA|nr:hypothetical protein Y032_0232g3041 [Ancylostoma ceylanicum]
MCAQIRRRTGEIQKELTNAVRNSKEDLRVNISDFLATNTNDSILDHIEALHFHGQTILTKRSKLDMLNETSANSWP